MTAMDLHADKIRCPADDVMTVWTKSVVDGAPLPPEPWRPTAYCCSMEVPRPPGP